MDAKDGLNEVKHGKVDLGIITYTQINFTVGLLGFADRLKKREEGYLL